jgi:hypothetical protein
VCSSPDKSENFVKRATEWFLCERFLFGKKYFIMGAVLKLCHRKMSFISEISCKNGR